MDAAAVLEVLRACRDAGIVVWLDGGWCIDALLGRQTRNHDDLDIAVPRSDVGQLTKCLAALGYSLEDREGCTEWNFVWSRAGNTDTVDVHVFEFDSAGNHIDGIAYPSDCFSGVGIIAGYQVRCVSAERIFQFKTSYPPKQKDRLDVRALSTHFGFELPPAYITY